jgi:hypothetical protein
MSGNNNDGSSKGPTKPGMPGSDPSAPKKPSALIDLKATEVKPAGVKVEPSAAPTAKPADAAAKPAAGETKPTTTASPSTVPPIAKATDSPADKASAKPAEKPADKSAQAPSMATTKAATAQATGATPKPAKTGGGILGVASHVFAGIAGGFLALLGADAIGPQLGLPMGGANMGDVQKRLAVIEEAAKAKPLAPSSVLTQKLAAAEARLAKMEEASRTLPALTAQQSKLADETRALADKLAKPAPGADAEKLAKLEEALATLSAAAGTDPQRGRIPQLAQITGKLADLEATFGSQMAAARKNVAQDVESRLGQATEAAEQARAGVQRIDRDLGAVKTEAARNGQRLEQLDQSVRGVTETASTLRGVVDGLTTDLAAQLKTVARPQDVSSALAPLNSKLAAVEQNLAGVVKSEDDRRTSAERIVLSLELANLKRALDRGGAFAAELANVQKAGGAKFDFKALEAAKDKGVPTTTALTAEFRNAAYAIIAADAEPTDGSVIDKLISGAKSVVRVRKTNADVTDTSAEAIAARMDLALKANRLGDIVEEAKKLSPKARKAGDPWLASVEARAVVDRVLAEVDAQLKTSLGGKP